MLKIKNGDSRNYDPEDPTGDLLRSLERRGYGIYPDFVDPTTVDELLFEIFTLYSKDEFQQAGVGVGRDYMVLPEVRSDRIHWFHREFPSPVQKKVINEFQVLKDRIRDHFRIPLSESEYFYAAYPPGGGYRKHYDNFKGDSRRLITSVLYLNKGWTESMGGALRIFRPVGEDLAQVPDFPREKEFLDILPLAGRLAVFLTPLMPHAVVESRDWRYSIVSWSGSSRGAERLPL